MLDSKVPFTYSMLLVNEDDPNARGQAVQHRRSIEDVSLDKTDKTARYQIDYAYKNANELLRDFYSCC